MTKALLESAEALKLSKEDLSRKGQQLLDLADMCGDGKNQVTMDYTHDSNVSTGKMQPIYDAMKKGSDFVITAKSKTFKGIGAIASSLPTSVSCHSLNGILVGLVTGYVTAHMYSLKKQRSN